MLTQQQLQMAIREAEEIGQHLGRLHVRLAEQRVTETRGPATVTLNGLGGIESLSIEGVDPEVQDCLLAALRAAEGRAQQGYDAFLEGMVF